MSAIALRTPDALPAAFNPELFAQFVAWIDRGARTTQTYLTNLRQFAAWMHYSGTDRPTRASVIAFRDWLTSEHDAIIYDGTAPQGFRYRLDPAGRRERITCKVTTAANYLRCVVQFFRWASDAGLYPNIASNIHAPKVRKDLLRKAPLKAREVLAIQDNIRARAAAHLAAEQAEAKDRAGRVQRSGEQGLRLQAMYLLAVSAGLRCVELSRARVRDFQTIDGRAYLQVWGKGREEPDRRKGLAHEVAAVLRSYLQARKDRAPQNSPLFVATGNRSGGAAIAPTTISKMLKGALQGAGFDSATITAHSLRHTAGNAVQELTRDLYATQQYMRHQNPATTEIYIHCHDDEKDAELAQKLFDYYAQTAQRNR
jgi:site-specific recombinase XerD